jgi:hypothetical protein
MGHQMGSQLTDPIMAITGLLGFLSIKILMWLKISHGERGWYFLQSKHFADIELADYTRVLQ